MKPEATKPETTKPEKRGKLKGMEAAQAALMLVVGIVIVLVIYFVVVGMISSTPVPNVQVDSYNSYIVGNTATVVLKFGKSASVSDVVILGESNNQIKQIASCKFPSGASSPMSVTAGQEYTFTCTLNQDATWQTNMIVQVTFADGSVANVRWVTG